MEYQDFASWTDALEDVTGRVVGGESAISFSLQGIGLKILEQDRDIFPDQNLTVPRLLSCYGELYVKQGPCHSPYFCRYFLLRASSPYFFSALFSKLSYSGVFCPAESFSRCSLLQRAFLSGVSMQWQQNSNQSSAPPLPYCHPIESNSKIA